MHLEPRCKAWGIQNGATRYQARETRGGDAEVSLLPSLALYASEIHIRREGERGENETINFPAALGSIFRPQAIFSLKSEPIATD